MSMAASFCGVYGHKPTFGLFPKRGPNLSKHPYEVSVRGVLARSAEDLQVLTEVLAQPDDRLVSGGSSMRRAWKLRLPVPTKSRLSQYKVAVWADQADFGPVHDDVRDAAEVVAKALESKGVSVSREARPAIDLATNFQTYTQLTAANTAYSSGWGAGATPYKGSTTLSEYRKAQETRELLREQWEAFFDEYDVLICPSHSSPAFTKDETLEDRKWERKLTIVRDGKDMDVPYFQGLFWAFLTNVSHLPSTTFPVGIGKISGLPIGMNVVSKEYFDLICIDFSRLVATECGFDFEPPPNYGPDATSTSKAKL